MALKIALLISSLTLLIGCTTADKTSATTDQTASATSLPTEREFDQDTTSGSSIDTSDEPADDIEVPLIPQSRNENDEAIELEY
ncbi:MAG: hypothetical protein V4692_09685 [Bdellovibrionota bacterium]